MKNSTKFLFLFSWIAITSYAQETQKSIDTFINETNATVTINKNTNTAEFIKFSQSNHLELEGTSVEEKAFFFLEKYKNIFKIESVNESFLVESLKIDNYGFKKLTLNQVHNTVPVYDGKLRFHFNTENQLTAINGNYIPNLKLPESATISKTEAETIALNFIKKQNVNISGTPLQVHKNTLYVFQKGLVQNAFTSQHLAYEIEIRNNNDVREFIFVDAHSQKIIEQFTGMAHTIDRVVYEDNTGNTVWEEGDTFPGTLTIWQQNEVEASGHVYHFFNNIFGYTSYDDADAQMQTINNNPNISCPNANWNGATANYCDGTASDDVIAHEWGHAYTQYTSGLIYAWQSGAINESYSDIWGETVDIINNYEDTDDDQSLRTGCSSSDRWMIGEDATAFGSAIRDMWNPNCKGDPGKVTDNEYHCDTSDSGGVHINSSVPNHAYALLVDGGTYNGQTITGIGFTKAAHIFWRAQSTYLTATSDFYALADALETSATDLLGINLEGLTTTSTPAGLSGEVITNSDYNQLVKAILAVELRINPDACNFQPILQATADLCEAANNNPVFLEDWESGIGSWIVSDVPSNPSTWQPRDWTIVTTLPNGRAGQGIFGADPINGDCSSDLQNGIIRLESPLISLPNFTTGNFELAFHHNIATEALWDGGNIKYSTNSGLSWSIVPSTAFTNNAYNDTLNISGNDNPMNGEDAFTGTDEGTTSGSWGKSVIDLSLIGIGANDSVKFRWELGTDGCNGVIGWYLDDIVVYNCDRVLSVSQFETLNSSIKVYPNPSSGLFTLQKTQNIELNTATVHDINGRFIKTIDLSTMQMQQDINISNLASGIYFMTVASPESKMVIKLLKE